MIGEGGLIREVALPPALAGKLEAQRRDAPVTRMDRGIQILSYYNLPGGQRLTSAWSKASKFELGWSTGIHGLRHYVPFLIMSTKMKDPAGMIGNC